MEAEARQHRPLGVTIIAILVGISGLIELIVGILAIVGISAAGAALAAHGHTTSGTAVDVLGDVLGAIPIVIGIVTLIFTWGLWTLRRWAFWLVVIFEAISLLQKVIELVRPHVVSNTSIIIGMVLPVIILLYFLVDANVRRAFRI